MVTRKVWGLGKRIFRNDFKRKWILFRYLVQSVMVYGVKLWRWEAKEEKVMLDYVRCIQAGFLHTEIYYNKGAEDN